MPSKSLLPSTSSPTATRDGLPATSLLLPLSLRSLVTIGWFQVPVMCNPGPAIQPIRNPSAPSILEPLSLLHSPSSLAGRSKFQSYTIHTLSSTQFGVSSDTQIDQPLSLLHS